MKITKYTSYFLGITIFLFGVLKLFSPFKEWTLAQIAQSDLPPNSFSLVIFLEILVGTSFLLPYLFKAQLRSYKIGILVATNIIFIMIMSIASYVHVQPNVSAEVLPLKIKEPVIPIFYIIIAFINMFSLRNQPLINR